MQVLINAEGDGVVEYVDANEIHVRYERTENRSLVSFEDDLKVYKLTKFIKTNQSYLYQLKPMCKGQKVRKVKFLNEGYATQKW
jgi:DNA-directed RNA polymerase subunit beta